MIIFYPVLQESSGENKSIQLSLRIEPRNEIILIPENNIFPITHAYMKDHQIQAKTPRLKLISELDLGGILGENLHAMGFGI